MLKEQKGITLVALIITIIVMLILAGVSISLVVGDNGVLTQAQDVEPKQVQATLKEAISLANADIMAVFYGDTSTAKVNAIQDLSTASVTGRATIMDKIIANYSYNSKNPVTIKGSAPALPTSTSDPAAEVTLTIGGLESGMNEVTFTVTCKKVVQATVGSTTTNGYLYSIAAK